MIGIKVDTVFCTKHCKQHPDYMRDRIDHAKRCRRVDLKRVAKPDLATKTGTLKAEPADELVMAWAAAITICGGCGKHRAKECESRPCAIKSGRFIECPDGQWTIEQLKSEAIKQIGA